MRSLKCESDAHRHATHITTSRIIPTMDNTQLEDVHSTEYITHACHSIAFNMFLYFVTLTFDLLTYY